MIQLFKILMLFAMEWIFDMDSACRVCLEVLLEQVLLAKYFNYKHFSKNCLIVNHWFDISFTPLKLVLECFLVKHLYFKFLTSAFLNTFRLFDFSLCYFQHNTFEGGVLMAVVKALLNIPLYYTFECFDFVTLLELWYLTICTSLAPDHFQGIWHQRVMSIASVLSYSRS